MTLKTDFEAILARYGHDTLLLHSDKQTTCTCYNPTTGSVDKDCVFCFGMGSIPVIERHRVRERDMNVPETLPYLANMQLFGELAIATRSYYMKAEVAVRPNDLIVDVDWQGDQPVYVGRGLYQVSHVDAKRFENGEFIYQKVYVKDNPIDKEIRSINIIERAGIILYQMEGDRL